MSHVDFKKRPCRPVEFFKKRLCRPGDFKKASCCHVYFKKVACCKSLKPKMDSVALSILGVYTPVILMG